MPLILNRNYTSPLWLVCVIDIVAGAFCRTCLPQWVRNNVGKIILMCGYVHYPDSINDHIRCAIYKPLSDQDCFPHPCISSFKVSKCPQLIPPRRRSLSKSFRHAWAAAPKSRPLSRLDRRYSRWLHSPLGTASVARHIRKTFRSHNELLLIAFEEHKPWSGSALRTIARRRTLPSPL